MFEKPKMKWLNGFMSSSTGMWRFRFLLFGALVTLAMGCHTAAPPHSPAASIAAPASRTSDNGNGTYSPVTVSAAGLQRRRVFPMDGGQIKL